MNHDPLDACFAQDKLDTLFPPERADQFFEALLGDAAEGAYDIRLTYQGRDRDHLCFFFELHQRSGRCLACNLTYGLPQVFARHPVIAVNQIVEKLTALMGDHGRCGEWQLTATKEIDKQLHSVPLIVEIEPN